MIDIALLRENKEKYSQQILRKEPSFNVDLLLELDAQLRKEKHSLEQILAEKNSLAKIGKDITPELREKAKAVGQSAEAQKQIVDKLEQQFEDLALCCPNYIADQSPDGGKEQNKVVKTFGEKPSFDFIFKNHLDLNKELNWFSMETGAQIAGSQFVFYQEMGAKVIYALTRMMLKHNKANGFNPIIPPYLVSRESLWRNGSLPKFQGDFYDIQDENLSLTPTAEVCITNLFANKTLDLAQLPIRHCAWTSCFRREAGSYGATERGLIRIHQFEKVELYSITSPDRSEEELDHIVKTSCSFLEKLGLHYQVTLLAAQDTGFCAHKTYDIEVWLPGQNRYYEVSSCSTCTDFQSRRAKIRFKKSAAEKAELVHTLNGSALALPRLMVALLENFQQKDGSVKLPEILVKEMENLW